MELFVSVSASEYDFPMNDVDAYGDVLPGYCRNAEARLRYALSGGRLTPEMYRRLRDDCISAVGFMYRPLFPIRDTYIRRWVELYDTAVWTYEELCHFLDKYTVIGTWDGQGGYKRDVRSVLYRHGYDPRSALTDYLNSRKRKVENDVAKFKSNGGYDYSDLQFIEDYVALLIKDYANNRLVDDNALCWYVVGLNQY